MDPAIPPLPKRRCTVDDRVAPGGIGRVEHKTIGKVGASVDGQDWAEVPNTNEAGREMPAVCFQVSKQMAEGRPLKFTREKARVEAKEVSGLCSALNPPITIDEGVLEG